MKKPKVASQPKRVELLNHAATITGVDREAQYGAPEYNRACIGELAQVIHKYFVARGAASPEYLSNLHMIAEKFGRAIASPRPGDDTFSDGAAYFGLAGEALSRRK